MPYKLRESLLGQEKISYAKDDAPPFVPVLDCSAGSNPVGMPPAAQAAIPQATAAQVNHYPHHSGLRDAICRSLPKAGLNPRNVLLTAGSIEGITLVNTAFLREGAQVVGVCPQFSDYMSSAKLLGYDYQAVPLDAQAGYRFGREAMLRAIHPGLSLVYIDNPNNPTGQIIPLTELREVALRARECGACVVIDEAYGDFMPPENSAATLLHALDNVIVLRTFSKGWGLAGLRAGYLLASEELVAAIGKLSNPYVVSEPARLIADAALGDNGFLPACREKIAACKPALLASLGHCLHAAHTGDTVPICLLIHEDAGCDLSALLAEKGVGVVSGADFMGLSANSARLRLPAPEQLDALAAILKGIDSGEA